MHTYIYEICVYDLSLCHCLSLIAWDGYAYAMVSGCQRVISAVGQSLPPPLLETASPCLSLCVPG